MQMHYLRKTFANARFTVPHIFAAAGCKTRYSICDCTFHHASLFSRRTAQAR
jgi:hypothetical protein